VSGFGLFANPEPVAGPHRSSQKRELQPQMDTDSRRFEIG
jgi:hypothetical protein